MASPPSRWSMRPAVPSRIADVSVVDAASRRSTSSGSTVLVMRRTATPKGVDESSCVATAVTRSTNSCASSTISSVVFGEDWRVRDRVDGQQCVVGDDDISAACHGTGLLREAVGAEWATSHAEAFPRRHAQLGPGPVRHTGRQFVAVTGVGGGRPRRESLDVSAQRRCWPPARTARPRKRLRRSGSAPGPLWILFRHK